MSFEFKWDHDGVMEKVRKILPAAMELETEQLFMDAVIECPVGELVRGPRGYSFKMTKASKNRPALFIRDEKGNRIKESAADISWKQRRPGTLAGSILHKVRWKNGVCLGIVKAGYDVKRQEGDINAFYARWVEYGAKRSHNDIPPNPFMRRAGSKVTLERFAQKVREVTNGGV